MKRVLALLLIFIFGVSFAENTILAIVNNEVITLNSVGPKLNIAISHEEKIAIIDKRIDIALQLIKAREFDIFPTQSDINKSLIQLANINDISMEQLNSYPEISLITQEISEKLSILNLQRFITKDLILNLSSNELIDKCPATDNDIKIKQIKIAQIIISEIDDSDILSSSKDETIKEFLKKLSKHITKGASFESFAKLHSQHQSYANGGISDWITVNSPTTEMLDLLKNSEVSKVYSTNMGFAIAIKIDEHFISNNLEICKAKLTYLSAEKFYLNWLEELRDNADIEIYINNL